MTLKLTGRAIKEIQKSLRKARRLVEKNIMPDLAIGLHVIRGPDWKWLDQDSRGLLIPYSL